MSSKIVKLIAVEPSERRQFLEALPPRIVFPGEGHLLAFQADQALVGDRPAPVPSQGSPNQKEAGGDGSRPPSPRLNGVSIVKEPYCPFRERSPRQRRRSRLVRCLA